MKLEIIFGQVLKKLRLEKGVSQEELALSANLDRTYISMLERGKRQPTIGTLFAISKALQMNPTKLIDEVYMIFASFERSD